MSYSFWVLVVIASFLLAKVEINTEGAHGYAKNLPVTWRASNKWVKNFLGGTSYHLYMWGFMLSLVHLPFVVGLSWTAGREMLVISFLLFVTVLEDFLWFVLNPAVDEKTGECLYGIKNFKPEKIPWFEDRWFLFCPAWYWWYLPTGIGLYIGSIYV